MFLSNFDHNMLKTLAYASRPRLEPLLYNEFVFEPTSTSFIMARAPFWLPSQRILALRKPKDRLNLEPPPLHGLSIVHERNVLCNLGVVCCNSMPGLRVKGFENRWPGSGGLSLPFLTHHPGSEQLRALRCLGAREDAEQLAPRHELLRCFGLTDLEGRRFR